MCLMCLMYLMGKAKDNLRREGLDTESEEITKGQAIFAHFTSGRGHNYRTCYTIWEVIHDPWSGTHYILCNFIFCFKLKILCLQNLIYAGL
jgi:hypothetical protein